MKRRIPVHLMLMLLAPLPLISSNLWAQVIGQPYYMMIPNAGKCMSVENDSTVAGALIEQQRCGGGESQQWMFELLPERPGYQLRNSNSGMCLDVPFGYTHNSVLLQQFICKDGLDGNQNLNVLPVSAGARIVSLQFQHSGKCLDLPGGNQGIQVSVQQFGCHGGINQRFVLMPVF